LLRRPKLTLSCSAEREGGRKEERKEGREGEGGRKEGYGRVKGSCEHGNEGSGFIKCWEILEQLSNWRLLKISVCYELHKVDLVQHTSFLPSGCIR
jgi:hypothetical protein